MFKKTLNFILEPVYRIDSRINEIFRPLTEYCDKRAGGENSTNLKYNISTFWFDKKISEKPNDLKYMCGVGIISLSIYIVFSGNFFFFRNLLSNQLPSLSAKYLNSNHTGIEINESGEKIIERKMVYVGNLYSKATRLGSLTYGSIKLVQGVVEFSNKDYLNGSTNLFEGILWAYSGANSYLIQSCDDKSPRKDKKVLESLLNKIPKIKIRNPVYNKI